MSQENYYLCSAITGALMLFAVIFGPKIRKMTRGQIIRSCIGLFGVCLLIFGATRLAKPHITPENSESYIVDWAANMQFLNHKLPSHPESYWAYEIGITQPKGTDNMITVWRAKKKEGVYLTFSKNIRVPDVNESLLKALPEAARALFQLDYDTQINMARMSCSFDEKMKNIYIEKSVPITGLDELTFANLMNEMFQNTGIAAEGIPLSLARAIAHYQAMENFKPSAQP